MSVAQSLITTGGPGEVALRALTPSQIAFLERLPKAELHAHLNGSIPLPLLQELARDYKSSLANEKEKDDDDSNNHNTATAPAVTNGTLPAADVLKRLERLQAGDADLDIYEVFRLFPAIHALTSTPASLRRATRGVLSHFLDPVPARSGRDGDRCAAVSYLELRTTPRETRHMSRRVYLETVLDEVEARVPDAAALIVSLDRQMTAEVAREVLELAVQLRREGRRVVGVDLCGNIKACDVSGFVKLFRIARAEGLGVTLHIAETKENSVETKELLSCEPERLGHGTFLDEEARKVVLERGTCIEICLTSNLLCNTVLHLQDHHIRHYLARNHSIAISTDDILPFRNSILGEYALLMAPKPFGLGLTESEIEAVARSGMESRFPNPNRLP